MDRFDRLLVTPSIGFWYGNGGEVEKTFDGIPPGPPIGMPKYGSILEYIISSALLEVFLLLSFLTAKGQFHQLFTVL